ncbi:MAG: sigma-54-dependent Fis family transcriptional regulator, partial [Planctomycetia bacterium]|nr:sigma-54-dependent Fis family transcriptional regulator [Planctomycetia bacterium]
IMAEGNIVRLCDLPREILSRSAIDSSSILVDTDDLSSIERAKVIEVLRRESGNKTRAAKTLGIDRRKLYRLVEKYDIKASEVGAVRS